jgi:alkylation response protein AidB-like acyl-CoA dehydrogenase
LGKVIEPAGSGPASDKKVHDMPLDTALPQAATRIDWLARADALAETIAAQAAAHDVDDSFVADAYAQLKAEGFFKALVPVEFGGGGAEVAEICQVIRRLGAACGSTALAFAMHSHLVAVAAWRWRKQGAPTEGLLKRVAAEDLVLVSSGGSDWLASGGQAIKVEGGFKITARKAFSSGCLAGDLLVTSAVWTIRKTVRLCCTSPCR